MNEETYIVQLPSGRARLIFEAGKPTVDDLEMLAGYLLLMKRALANATQFAEYPAAETGGDEE